MTWKPRLVIAGSILLACIILTALGFDSFIQGVGYMAAGYLFGTMPPAKVGE